MHTKSSIFFIVLFCSGGVSGQRMYIEPHVRYSQTLTTQYSPVYFDLKVYEPFGSNGSQYINAASEIKKFSLSTTFQYGTTLGLGLNNIMSLEISGDYFKTMKTIISDAALFTPNDITRWNFQSFLIAPGIAFQKNHNNSTFVGRVAPVIAVSWLTNAYFIGQSALKSYRLNARIGLGYTLGFEYDHRVSHRLSLSAETGLSHFTYTPTRASLLKINGPTGSSAEKQNTYTRSIDYVRQVRNVTIAYDYSSGSFTTDPSRPEQRIKQAIQFDYMYAGIGVKYYITRK